VPQVQRVGIGGVRVEELALAVSAWSKTTPKTNENCPTGCGIQKLRAQGQ